MPDVPERDREDAVQLLHERLAVLLVEVGQHLAVAARVHPVAPLLEPLAQLAVVVDLAVEDRHDVARLVEERLLAVLGIDDREAPHSEAHVRVEVLALAVRPAVRHPRHHRAHQVAVDLAGGRMEPGYAAHARPRRPLTAVACREIGGTTAR